MTATERHAKWAAKNRKHLRRYQRKWRRRNRDKVRAYNREHYAYDPVKARDKALRRKFGITLAQYRALARLQRNKCAVCAHGKPRGRGTWRVDHNHTTGKVRGLLCSNCNLGIGLFGESPEKLKAAAKYLRKHSKHPIL